MPDNRVFVCFLKTEGLTRDVLTGLVPADDIRCADLFRDEARAIRALASSALRRWGFYTFLKEFSPVIRYGENGKPILSGMDGFNTSSTPGLAVFAYTSVGEIGVDVEAVSRCKDLGMSLQELQTWTDREAVAKGIGGGLQLALDGLTSMPDGSFAERAGYCQWTAWHLALPNQWVGSVATPGPKNCTVVIQEICAEELSIILSGKR